MRNHKACLCAKGGIAFQVGLLCLGLIGQQDRALALPLQPVLPTELAAQAALVALKSCQTKGLQVSVSVVNREGNSLVLLRNQNAGKHTVENSFNKAFTSVSFGGTYGVTSTRAIVAKQNAPKGIGAFPLPADPIRSLSYSIGGVSIVSNGVVIGAIGVSGSPSGDLDEACALQGLQAIEPQLR